jgi:hypothetical protein
MIQMRQYPASWRLWKVTGVSRTYNPVTIRVRADSHAEAIKIAQTRHYMTVQSCLLLDNT